MVSKPRWCFIFHLEKKMAFKKRWFQGLPGVSYFTTKVRWHSGNDGFKASLVFHISLRKQGGIQETKVSRSDWCFLFHLENKVAFKKRWFQSLAGVSYFTYKTRWHVRNNGFKASLVFHISLRK